VALQKINGRMLLYDQILGTKRLDFEGEDEYSRKVYSFFLPKDTGISNIRVDGDWSEV